MGIIKHFVQKHKRVCRTLSGFLVGLLYLQSLQDARCLIYCQIITVPLPKPSIWNQIQFWGRIIFPGFFLLPPYTQTPSTHPVIDSVLFSVRILWLIGWINHVWQWFQNWKKPKESNKICCLSNKWTESSLAVCLLEKTDHVEIQIIPYECILKRLFLWICGGNLGSNRFSFFFLHLAD